MNWCYLYHCDDETMDHLILHCKFAHAPWSELFVCTHLKCSRFIMVNTLYFFIQ